MELTPRKMSFDVGKKLGFEGGSGIEQHSKLTEKEFKSDSKASKKNYSFEADHNLILTT
jgi:hypothetical protein